MSAQDNRAIVLAMLEALNHGDLEESVSYTHPDCELDGKPFGREGDRTRTEMFLAAFPGQVWTADRIITEGEWVSLAYTFTGNFTGTYGNIPPSGKQIVFTGVSHYHLKGGQFVEIWEYIDRLSLYQQLGLIPAMT